ncbi:ATP-binding protein, partial [Virgisporangium ochraceum]|uniref:ATP-binding protein n=1 Tax=Virgisporangium ochraceum TaxID=65505 RepID=UPI00194576E6
MSIVSVDAGAVPDGSFVGRREELAALGHRLAQAARGRPSTVVVGGEAGVGKSRLLREFVAVSGAHVGHVLWGSCISLGSGEVPYAGLIDALRRLVREHGDDVLRLAGPHAYAELSGLVWDFSKESGAGPRSQLRVFGAVVRLLDRLGAE